MMPTIWVFIEQMILYQRNIIGLVNKDVAAYVSSQLNYMHMHTIRNPLLR